MKAIEFEMCLFHCIYFKKKKNPWMVADSLLKLRPFPPYLSLSSLHHVHYTIQNVNKDVHPVKLNQLRPMFHIINYFIFDIPKSYECKP